MMMNVHVSTLTEADRAAWLVLARGYKAFYKTQVTDDEYAVAWSRLMAQDGVTGLGAHVNGKLVGLAHYLFHSSTWTPRVCYLQDLFTDPAARGQGVARALIEAVAVAARQAGATRYYWLTQDDNVTARALYDRVATYHGFVRYDYPL
jgi:GNAT superfamily N-acetyltransferase